MTREEAICGLEDMLMSKLDGRNNLEVYGEEIPIMLVQDIEALKLAIEALQERPKGRWIELPCEIGDTVWLVPKYLGNPLGIIRKDKVQMIGVTSRGIHLKLREYHDHNKMYMLGKTVFLTKEEAEKALADMKGE